MRIRSLSIHNLRNHVNTQLGFCEGVNVLYGLNGAGKTTVLEALTICAFTKTFLPTSDAELCMHGADAYSLTCKAESDLRVPYTISISTGGLNRKTINSTIGNSLSPKDVIGEIPMVILSPDFKSITFGAPQERRAFLDRLLSQCSRRYYEELANLRRILRQRNSLLSDRSKFADRATLQAWTDQLVDTSAEITIRRRDFIRSFTPYFMDAYSTISHSAEVVSIAYRPDIEVPAALFDTYTKDDIASSYSKYASGLEVDELRRGLTLWGPQKDDVELRINDGIARDVASQGQHKSLLICLKKAEFEFLKDARNETPVLLLDDIFSELDEQRTARVFDTVIANAGQTFITTTEKERIRASIPEGITKEYFRIESGRFVRDDL